jgi:hypothetical protein
LNWEELIKKSGFGSKYEDTNLYKIAHRAGFSNTMTKPKSGKGIKETITIPSDPEE